MLGKILKLAIIAFVFGAICLGIPPAGRAVKMGVDDATKISERMERERAFPEFMEKYTGKK